MTTLSGLTHEEVLRELQATRGSARCPAAARRYPTRTCASRSATTSATPTSGSRSTRARRTGSASRATARCSTGTSRARERRVDHVLRIRALQDETHGFPAFIPLAFHPENTVFERRGWRHTTGADDLKMMAVSRLMLDNIPNVKAYWIMMGMPLASNRPALRGERRAGHRRPRADLPRRRRAHRDGAEGRGARPPSCARPAGSPSSATRSTTRSTGGTSWHEVVTPGHTLVRFSAVG